MNIDGLGEETIDLLFSKNLIRNFSDLYDLKWNNLSRWKGLGKNRPSTLLKALKNRLRLLISEYFLPLGIRHVGETVAKTIAGKVQNN